MSALNCPLNHDHSAPGSKTKKVSRTPVRQNLTFEQKLEVIDFYKRFEGYLTPETMVPFLREMGFWSICAISIRRCVRDEAKIRQYVSHSPKRLRSKRETMVTHPEVEYVLARWVDQKLNNSGRLRANLLIEKAHEVCDLLSIPSENRIRFSRGWLWRFKQRHGLHRIMLHGERASAPVEDILSERRRLQPILAQYAPRDRFSMDETALFFRQPASNLNGIGCHGSHLTYALCSNEDGSYKLPPIIIGREEHPACFPQHRTVREHGYWYFYNPDVRMKSTIWVEFLAELNEAMRLENRYILLLCDNAYSHNHNPADFPHIRVEYLSPNLTPWVQPMNSGIISAFKAHYRRRFAQIAFRCDDSGFTRAYQVDQREAMHIAIAAWDDITCENIAHCWHSTGITPPENYGLTVEPVAELETESVPMGGSLVTELDLVPENTHPEVYDVLAALETDLPTEDDVSVQQILQQMQLG